VVSKADAQAGYILDLVGGKPRLRLMAGWSDFDHNRVAKYSDGKWHHVVAEVNRTKGVTLYLDGKKVSASTTGAMPTGTLVNSADFLVGGGPGRTSFAGALDFLRLSRGTLADAHTTIAECTPGSSTARSTLTSPAPVAKQPTPPVRWCAAKSIRCD
jgi:hypothetical protein